jgi:ABC-type antimicrobial peptide transport system permease subunit
VVTTAGGGIGVVLGTAAAVAVARIGAVPAVVSWQPFAIAFLASTAVGLLSSIVPARRAAGVDPAAALRP